MSRTHRMARRFARVLLATGVLALGYASYVVADAKIYHSIEHRRFARAPSVSTEATLVDGDAVGEIRIPRLGLAAIVVQGDSPAILQRAVGHLVGSALPGEVGNVVLAGHRDTFFRPLKGTRVGDAITVRTRDGDFEYRVEATAVVPPSHVEVLQPTGGRTLTLITCFPFGYLGSAPDRFIVRARATEGRATIRRTVARPSTDFTTYVEGQLVQVSVPSNWRELPGSNAVTFAPEGAYGNAGVKSVFTHGVAIGLARNDKRDLRATTDDFIASTVLANPPERATGGRARSPFPQRRVTIGDRPGLHSVVSTISEATGGLQRIEIYTALLRDGTLFYLLAVAPRDSVPEYADTFRRVVESIEILDCDACVR
jgi:sortase A